MRSQAYVVVGGGGWRDGRVMEPGVAGENGYHTTGHKPVGRGRRRRRRRCRHRTVGQFGQCGQTFVFVATR